MTAGGHRRILESDLRRFITRYKIIKSGNQHANYTDYLIPPCWEVRGCGKPQKHNCARCLVFKVKANKCFLLVKRFGAVSIQCQEDCYNYGYLKKYYPKKRQIIEMMERKIFDSIQYQRGQRETSISKLFKRGSFVYGKYIGKIRKIVS
jgi:hypothetical protein